ncbi:hypothetical protein MHU86_15421 [Fragilaria crotonensis]|nr:hypothetical protein MHU86_15421 [Fragilaria crotonensis]
MPNLMATTLDKWMTWRLLRMGSTGLKDVAGTTRKTETLVASTEVLSKSGEKSRVQNSPAVVETRTTPQKRERARDHDRDIYWSGGEAPRQHNGQNVFELEDP